MGITEVDEKIARSIAFRITPLMKFYGLDEEDALQEALIALWETYDPEDCPSHRYHKAHWRVCNNVLNRYRRCKRVRLRFPERFDYGRCENVDDKLDALFYLEKIGANRDLVERHYLRGETYEEIGASVGLNAGAVQGRVRYELQKLRGQKKGVPKKPYYFDLSRLDGKERDVAELLNRGLTRKEVADALGISLGFVTLLIHVAKMKILGRYDQWLAKRREYGRTKYLRKKLGAENKVDGVRADSRRG